MKLHFSYSTLDMLLTCNHCWMNKIMGIKQEETVAMKEGSDGHKIIQEHVGGIKADDRLKFLTERFPTVEKRRFDNAVKFDLDVDGYSIIGFLDMIDEPNLRFGEIKLSSTPWTPRKFKDHPQRKIYALAHPTFTSSLLITGPRDPSQWSEGTLKLFDVPLTQKDRDEALAWIRKGLAVFEEGDFTQGLDPDTGRCIDPRCRWGKNCHYKKL